jgi:hypothetical protein
VCARALAAMLECFCDNVINKAAESGAAREEAEAPLRINTLQWTHQSLALAAHTTSIFGNAFFRFSARDHWRRWWRRRARK